MAEQHPDSYYKTPFKFSGKEMDEETGLHYFGARYYDSRSSIWLSVDPLAEKYPSIGPYVYVASNPINAIDPDGKQIFPIHGTWSDNSTWKDLKGIRNATSKLFGDSKVSMPFQWSGGNYDVYRKIAANELIDHIRSERKGMDSSEPITLVGHSHGGNVAILAANMLSKLDEFNDVQINLLTINTPARSDYQLSETARKRVNHVNVYDPSDPVQIHGGNMLTTPIFPSTIKGTGDYGPAAREFSSAKQNIQVINSQGIFGDFHNSHNRTRDWIDDIED
ncbi:RHS repeat-associated protein [Flavobacterium arsenatis]|uniref:RHS repeat-associated protein n=2 Tax=Flavobacterium arsenatis TaxID=1484332 RepID=A0ABU1TTP5_9FLAO|nr:RHS repeat-associated protein [Flavobacterium arsenatis]